MRLNKFIALCSGISRRAADQAVVGGKVLVNNERAALGQIVDVDDVVTVDGLVISPPEKALLTIAINKPVGYVCSRRGQGNKTIYDLLPEKYHHLKPVGRLDKDSSGLLLLTNDGDLANRLSHPRYQKEKVYDISLDKVLSKNNTQKLVKGVKLDDGLSNFISLKPLQAKKYQVKIAEGRNRQIRRTFKALGYEVINLHRVQFGNYKIESLELGSHKLAS